MVSFQIYMRLQVPTGENFTEHIKWTLISQHTFWDACLICLNMQESWQATFFVCFEKYSKQCAQTQVQDGMEADLSVTPLIPPALVDGFPPPKILCYFVHL